MPKIIFTSQFYKSGERMVGLLKYVAIREGVELPKNFDLTRPATNNQRRLIAEILTAAPDAKDCYEYEDYAAAPNVGNASAFIASAFENHPKLWTDVRRYVSYIAKRPGAVRSLNGHGLWNGGDAPIDLAAVADEVANHGGYVWTHVVSLRRADAERCGYATADAWRQLVREKIGTVADAMKIPLDNLRWYAAYHDKQSNPHIHLMVYSTNPREGYLTEPCIEKMRSAFATAIYKDELLHIYTQKDVLRSRVNEYADQRIRELAAVVGHGSSDELLIEMLCELSQQLQSTTGKKQYGYLKPPLKKLVDEIVERLSAEPSIAEMYRHWCDLAAEQKRIYKSVIPEPLPLVQEPTFKTLKNLVIRAAAQGDDAPDIAPEPPDVTAPETPDVTAPDIEPDTPADKLDTADHRAEWAPSYKAARKLLYGEGKELVPAYAALLLEAEDGNALAKLILDGKIDGGVAEALRWLTASAEQQNQYAQFAVGMLYFKGDGVERDRDEARRWFELSAAQGNEYAQAMLDFNLSPSLITTAVSLLRSLATLIGDDYTLKRRGIEQAVDSKLMQKIRRKKQELGQRWE